MRIDGFARVAPGTAGVEIEVTDQMSVVLGTVNVGCYLGFS